MTAKSSKEVFQLAGDAPDPVGVDPTARGLQASHDFTAAAVGHPIILAYVGDKPVLLTADVYALPGQPRYVIINCPMCLASGRLVGLRIVESEKAIHFELEAPPTWPSWSRTDMQSAIAVAMGLPENSLLVPSHLGGRISIEPLRCTWETEPEPGRDFSFSRCPWAVAIDNNVARNVR